MLTKTEKAKIKEYRQVTKAIVCLMVIFFAGNIGFEILSRILFN